jgi:hypothetical protein
MDPDDGSDKRGPITGPVSLRGVRAEDRPESLSIGKIGPVSVASAQWGITVAMLVLFALTVVGIFVLYALHDQAKLDVRDVHDLATTLITSEIALLASIVGFYFGERRGSS